jgi:hypothetical protein
MPTATSTSRHSRRARAALAWCRGAGSRKCFRETTCHARPGRRRKSARKSVRRKIEECTADRRSDGTQGRWPLQNQIIRRQHYGGWTRRPCRTFGRRANLAVDLSHFRPPCMGRRLVHPSAGTSPASCCPSYVPETTRAGAIPRENPY